jgi:uncharacterized protein YceK
MKKFLILLVAISTVGCGSAFTSIQPAGEKTYVLTQNQAGFFKVSGVLYECQADGLKMTCTEIDAK